MISLPSLGKRLMSDRIFVDSNVWLYAFILGDQDKHGVAKLLLDEHEERIVVSSQIVHEVSVNLLKKAQMSESALRRFLTDVHRKYRVEPCRLKVDLKASELRETHCLSYWDSLVVAAALESDCSKLFTEDLQDGQVFEERLTVVNPFKVDEGRDTIDFPK